MENKAFSSFNGPRFSVKRFQMISSTTNSHTFSRNLRAIEDIQIQHCSRQVCSSQGAPGPSRVLGEVSEIPSFWLSPVSCLLVAAMSIFSEEGSGNQKGKDIKLFTVVPVRSLSQLFSFIPQLQAWTQPGGISVLQGFSHKLQEHYCSFHEGMAYLAKMR